ncbi:hypothetical protein [Cryobacterium sp. MDB2-33-2]|uniref:hypothetical protein n=1 Tax=Cryobacterium sp. MDB2-33-2 TaxID=1259179 RepID=UPI001068F162|nr:hypothetical protein [Cryobacterium sp. MDB2-33-2]TFC06546.1 hypothetical protein E3O59_10245 [Cryobacterium sp. MDB2-33-2]
MQPTFLDFINTIIAAVAAFGTAAAVVTALVIASKEGRRIRKDADWNQAQKISAWVRYPDVFRPDSGRTVVSNSSDAQIWDVFLSEGSVSRGDGAAYKTGSEANACVLKVPPGLWMLPFPPRFGQGSGMGTHVDVSISFRDARGLFWRRDANGKLTQTEREPESELQVDAPHGWDTAQPAGRN